MSHKVLLSTAAFQLGENDLEKKNTWNLGLKWKSTSNEAGMVMRCIQLVYLFLIGHCKELDPFCTSVVGVTHFPCLFDL